MAISETRAEHIVVFALLCGMTVYLAKTLFSFRSSGLSLRRNTDDDDSDEAIEEELDGDADDHSD